MVKINLPFKRDFLFCFNFYGRFVIFLRQNQKLQKIDKTTFFMARFLNSCKKLCAIIVLARRKSMDISYKTENGGICAELSGELDEYSAEYVRLSLDDLLNKNLSAKKLVLDFSRVSFMDSTGIGMLLGRYNKFAKNDISLFIKNPTSYVNRIFEMTGIYQIIPKVC